MKELFIFALFLVILSVGILLIYYSFKEYDEKVVSLRNLVNDLIVKNNKKFSALDSSITRIKIKIDTIQQKIINLEKLYKKLEKRVNKLEKQND